MSIGGQGSLSVRTRGEQMDGLRWMLALARAAGAWQ